MLPKRVLFCALLLALVAGPKSPVAAQRRLPLTIDTIMRGPGLYGFAPQDVRWSGDGQRLYFEWKQAGDNPESPRDTYFVYRDRGAPVKLSDEDARMAPPASAVLTRDRSRAVYSQRGDIFLYDYSTDKARQLTRTADPETNPRFTRDEQGVAFTRGGNLYTLAIDTGMIEQWTELQPAGSARRQSPSPAASTEEKKIESSQEFLERQEKELIQAVREKLRLRDAAEGKRKRENPRKPYELQARQTASDFLLCPGEQCVIAMIDEKADGAKPDNVPNYVTVTGYTEEIPGRTNVGDKQPHTKVAVLSAETGDLQWLETGLGDRAVTYTLPVFNDRGTQAVLIARAADNKDRWILALDTGSAKGRVVFAEHDDAWLGGPGDETLGWLKNGNEIYFQSERDGWAHLYTVSAAGGEPKQLTSGKFEVTSVDLSNDGTQFRLTTTESGAAERHVYSMSVQGGPRTRITTEPGSHRLIFSRDEKYFADVHSYVNRPPELFVAENRTGAKLEKRTDSPSRDFWEYPWLDAPIVQVPARDGAAIPARFFKPANYRPGGPAVIFVHGAGYLQNVHKYWSPNYPREFLFHHFLMEQGYMVLDLDYRASAGYGRDWRTAIYRHMGGKDLEDNVDGAKWLVEQGADPKRIGIYGGSYGGFITLMAMFTTPDVFAAGAALRPVTDWSHYNHEYTSNILNTPQTDPEAFRRSSPIYFAEGLKGALLICHGMVDTNVFFQDTVRLVQRLIELKKENWSVAMYPVENHGFVKASSWADEYKRIFQLFETSLKKP
jgi:dipeptidyl aminopeptidase/acylaminoacyl peptidase